MRSIDLICKYCHEFKSQIIRYSTDLLPPFVEHLQCTGCEKEWITCVQLADSGA
jgi:hypothetical protein